ncbi:MAG: deoxyribonuclease IV [Candidatus Promineofilum sp.]|nr:deoxyribonuclease IV [Promineifilum sp.]
MRLGTHISTAGGAYRSFQRARDAGCDSFLIFTKSNRQWAAKALTDDDITAYGSAVTEHADICPVAVHAAYLINVASPDPALWERSYEALKDEVERAAALGIDLITFHPGSYMSSSEQEGLAAIARALRRLLAETADTAPNTIICLETMAGQGTNLGGKFEHLATIIEQAGGSQRLGVCFDTCHVFAAGYDIRTPEAYAATMAEFDRVIGLERIRCFHFNDSKFGLGTGKDRHEHIGRGEIGLPGFANFLNDPRWADHCAHLETPPTEDGDDGASIDMNLANLAALRQLRRQNGS